MRKRRRWNDYVTKRNVIRYNRPRPNKGRKKSQHLNFGWEMTELPPKFTFDHLESVLIPTKQKRWRKKNLDGYERCYKYRHLYYMSSACANK